MISIVIPTLQKRPDILIQLIDTLLEDKGVGEVIIIDNSGKGLDYNDKRVRVINLGENIFVNLAWNLGVKEAKYEIVGLLNDDIKIPKNLSSKIAEKIDKNTGIVGPKTEVVITKPEFDDKELASNVTLEPVESIPFSFGIAMYFNKKVFNYIPNDLKIYYGDNWIFEMCKRHQKQNYAIDEIEIYHMGSLSSNDFLESDKNDFFNNELTQKENYFYKIHINKNKPFYFRKYGKMIYFQFLWIPILIGSKN